MLDFLRAQYYNIPVKLTVLVSLLNTKKEHVLRKNLTYEQIIAAAIAEAVTSGYDGISLRQIAARLGVKPASLYNHVSGIDDIRAGIAVHAANALRARIVDAITGKDRDTAFLEGARVYRAFATEESALYHAFIFSRMLDDTRVHEAGRASFEPLIDLIRSYGLDEYETLNFHRALRSAIHGYIELCNNGFMSRGGVSSDESYSVMINGYLGALHYHANNRKEKTE